jgi:hypothetical protein
MYSALEAGLLGSAPVTVAEVPDNMEVADSSTCPESVIIAVADSADEGPSRSGVPSSRQKPSVSS